MSKKDVLTQSKKKQAVALLQNNRLQDARSLFEKICHVDRNDVESLIFLVKINAQLGHPAEVEKYCGEIIRIMPHSHEAHYHLGCALLLQNKCDDAIRTFQHALHLKPDHAPTHLNLGYLSVDLGEALKHYRHAAQLEPNYAQVHASLGAVLLCHGQIEEAISSYRRALSIDPRLWKVRSDMISAMNYGSNYDAHAIFLEHARWGSMHVPPPVLRHPNTPVPDRRLRVGYVSPDLREHSVSYFFEPLLANHSAEEVETFCYAEVDHPDSVTKRLQCLAAHWYSTCGVSDQDLVDRIRADGIDILVDLTGHTMNHRLLAFSVKPAPVQVTYLGYPNTTAVGAIDYRLTDACADPPGKSDSYHTEKLIRLPHGFLCYLPPQDSPPVTASPVKTRGHITFGSFNNIAKINPSVVSLWAAILQAVPNARLILKNHSLRDRALRERYIRLFEEHHIAPDRLDFRGPNATTVEHLSSYGEIDIALDTFPYNGTTTTCEATLMGVPVVTLAGHMHAGRVGTSLLTQLGLTGLVAETPEEYVRIACALAGNVDELSHLRASLRGRMMNSSLCDGKGFARDVESAYRAMWKNWCMGHGK